MILYGQLFSKANSRRAVTNRRTGRAMYIKSQKALDCVRNFTAQALEQWEGPPLDGPVLMVAHIWYPSRRQDLDESLLMDILQGIAYYNDRQIERKAITKNIDKDNPRVDVKITLLGIESEVVEKMAVTKKKPVMKKAPAKKVTVKKKG